MDGKDPQVRYEIRSCQLKITGEIFLLIQKVVYHVTEGDTVAGFQVPSLIKDTTGVVYRKSMN